jgi:hypothetical protein
MSRRSRSKSAKKRSSKRRKPASSAQKAHRKKFAEAARMVRTGEASSFKKAWSIVKRKH